MPDCILSVTSMFIRVTNPVIARTETVQPRQHKWFVKYNQTQWIEIRFVGFYHRSCRITRHML